ncbi:hypothetical protein PoB_002633000 [Plakobranchus ocellatus]|uniref:Uncharacterized protein n=1 Tax=Plakobranchus ocellatus TaxID=259542 RepID=A0AAV3ZX97_9GAST|nr:hypothetical protein PoB_002633000 [Plakobranchus ocellatus]
MVEGGQQMVLQRLMVEGGQQLVLWGLMVEGVQKLVLQGLIIEGNYKLFLQKLYTRLHKVNSWFNIPHVFGNEQKESSLPQFPFISSYGHEFSRADALITYDTRSTRIWPTHLRFFFVYLYFHRKLCRSLKEILVADAVGQRKRWVDNIREWTGFELRNTLRKAEDREKWKAVVRRSSAAPRRIPDLWDR